MAKGEIGDPLDEVARTGKLGKRSHPSKSSNFQNAEMPDIQRAESPSSQISEPSEGQKLATSNAQKSKSPELQNVEASDVPSVEVPTSQTAEHLNTQPFEMVKGQTMHSLAVQESKGTHKGRTQKTIYLPPALAKRLKFAAVEEEREISEIVADALEAYFKNKEKGSN